MKQSVELIYDLDCPNIKPARAQIMKAFAQLSRTANWKEWDRHSKDCPAYAKQYGSPTILVNKEDVAGEHPREHSDCCRLYRDETGSILGVPSVEAIVQSFLQTKGNSKTNEVKKHIGWKGSLLTFPGIVLSFLPSVSCPLCWPAYASVLSAIGLGFLLEKEYLFSTTVVFLLLILGTLAFRAQTRRGYGPFLLGVFGVLLLLIGKFLFDSTTAMYVGIGILVTTTIWNAWPRKKSNGCSACVDNSSKLIKTKTHKNKKEKLT